MQQQHEQETQSSQEHPNNMKIKTSAIPWTTSVSNWIVAHGCLESSITVDSSDYISESDDPEAAVRRSPLVLEPAQGLDSEPCEIKICFEQKYNICQIYVRSTARVYEVYYAHSPQSDSEYLCTVRCGVAERDEKLLQTTCIENQRDGERSPEELTEESVPGGGNIVTSEDDWVKIKVPEVGKSSLSNKTNINRVKNVQDLYEATAQISDADPCSWLTIRLLSLQDKSQIYVDEIYLFVDPVESTDSGNEAVLAGSSAQSSLMAMFVPTLLQLSKSGVKQVQDKHASDPVVKDDKIETGSRKIDEIDINLEKNQADRQNMKSKELDEDTAESVEHRESTLSPNTKKDVNEPIRTNDFPSERLEIALEQLISRVSRVEDICLRFEEKLLKPIESMEARLQRVENQLEKLVKNTQESGLPHCTRFTAPEFSCSESNSSSFHNDQSDNPPRGSSNVEKKDCCNTPDLPQDAKYHPGLIVSAPEFSCGEDEENTDDLRPLKDSPCVKPKKTLSVDDALAAALSGFLSEHVETTSGISNKVDEENHYAAENGNTESSQYTQILTVKAPDFPAEEIGDEDNLNRIKSLPETPSVFENEEKGHEHEMVYPSAHSESLCTSADSSDLNTFLGNRHLNESSDSNTIDSVENPRKTADFDTNDEDIASKRVLGHECESLTDDVPNVPESSSAPLLDFEFPILEVKFTSDLFSSSKSPLEALLDGSAESNIEAPSVHDIGDDGGNSEQINAVAMDGNGMTDLLPSNDLLVDFGVSSVDGCVNSEDGSQESCARSNPKMNVSLEDTHNETSKKLPLSPNVLCSKSKRTKGSKSFTFGKLKGSKSVKLKVSIRQPGPSTTGETISSKEVELEQSKIADTKLDEREGTNLQREKMCRNQQHDELETRVENDEDMQGGVQCAQQ